jgi:DNA repair protein RadC
MEEYKTNFPITEWAESDRPREKMLTKGKAALSDAELIAILIRAGTRKESAVDISKRILGTVNDNLIELSKLSVKDLQKFKGIGEAKALSIIAALELGKRRREADVIEKQKITCSRDVFEIFQASIADKQYEEFWVLLLNRANKIINKINISEGGISGTVVDPKKVFNKALEHNASSIILCHNHPSGNTEPSEADIKLTNKLKLGGEQLDLPVLDHVIIGDEKYFSFKDEGKL